MVTIDDGEREIAWFVADATAGDWSYNFADKPLKGGDHTLSASVTDEAGNVSERVNAVTVTIDLAPPAASSLNVSNDNVDPATTINNNGYTNDTTPLLSGTADPGGLVTIYDVTADGTRTEIGSVQASASDGSWSYNVDLETGSHALSVVVTDTAGNVGVASDVVNINIQTAIPDPVTDFTVSNNEGNTLVTIPNDGSTNDVTPELDGTTSVPGGLITIYNGNTEIGSTLAGADGKWSFTTDELNAGTYNFNVTVTDVAGNTSVASPDITVTIDLGVPEQASELQFINDNGTDGPVPITGNDPTNDNTPLLTGVAETGSTVTISENGTVLGTVVVTSEDGNWSFSTPTLRDGDHTLTVSVTDAAGNVNASDATIAVSIDTQAPDVAGNLVLTNDANDSVIPNGGLTNDRTPVLTGTAEADSTVTVSINGGAPVAATIDDQGNWTFTPPADLLDGTYTFSVVVTDAAGNASAAVTTVAEILATTPAVGEVTSVTNDNGTAQITTGGITYTSDNTPVIAGTATPGTIVTIYSNGFEQGSTTVGNDGSWSFTPTATLPEGVNDVTVTVTDAAGNTSAPSPALSFTVDTAPPEAASITITNDNGTTDVAVLDGTATNDNTPLLSGGAEPNSIVTIYDTNGNVIGSTQTLENGTWSLQSPILSDTTHTLTITVTDEIGNVSADTTIAFTVDTQSPDPVSDLLLQNNNDDAALITIADGGYTNDSTPVLTGNAEIGSTITITYTFEGETGTATVTATDGTWSYTPAANLLDGAYTYSVTVTDAAGNISTPSILNFNIDTAAPAVGTYTVSNNNGATPITIAQDGLTNDNTPVLRGSGAEAGSVITISATNSEGVTTELGTAIVADNGQWRFVATTLDQGLNTLSITATDAAGNVTTGASFNVNVDSLPPEAPAGVTATVSDGAGGTEDLTNGLSTDQNVITFGGTAEADSIITIYDGTNVLGSVVATGGEWTFITPVLSNGLHSFTATATDAAGNVSAVAPPTPYTQTIDAAIPEATTSLVVTDDSGISPVVLENDADTRDTTPVLSGLTDPETVIYIFDNGTLLDSVTSDINGQWSYTFTQAQALDQGIHIIGVGPNNTTPADTLTINIDSLPPAVVTDLVVNNNNGGQPVEVTTGATNDNTPLLTGTGEEGATITVYDGNTVLGTTTVDAEGNWSFQTATLTSGPHSFSVTASDALGNVSERSTAVPVTIDTIAPAAATLVVTNDAGTTLANGASTNDSTPTLSGTVEAGATVSIYLNGSTTPVGTAVVTGTTWTYTPTTPLIDGTYTIAVRATDLAGNTSVLSTSSTVVIDTVAPTGLTLNAGNNNGSTVTPITSGGSTNDSTPFLSGTAEAGSLVIIRENGTAIGSVTVGANGNWSFATTTALGDGLHTLTATATDAAGNIGAQSSVNFTVSTGAPTTPTLVITNDVTAVTVPNNGATNDSTPTLSGTATAGNIITIYDGTTVLGSTTAIVGDTWSFNSPTLANGSHTLTISATDTLGNATAQVGNTTFTIDTVAPVNSTLVIANDNGTTPVTVANGGSTNDTTPRLSGVVSTAEAGGIVRVYDNISGNLVQVGSAVVQADGTWSTNSSALTAGTHPLSVTVTDAAGNVSGSTTASVIIDTTPPAVQLTNTVNNNGTTTVAITNGGSTNDSTPGLSGTAEAGSLVVVRDGQTVVGSVVAAANGTWSITTSSLGEGSHTLSVTATDAAGNVGTATNTITFTVSTAAATAPTLVVNNDANSALTPVANNGVTNDSTPTLTGTATAGNVITIYDGTTVLGTTTAGTGNTWSFTSPTLSNGSHALSVTATNAAGTVSTAVSSTVVIDTIAPVNSTLVIANDNGTTPVTVANGGSTNDTTPRLSGVVSTAEAGGIVRVYDNISGNLVQVGSAVVQADGTWSTNSSALTAGTHPLSVTVTDAAGNVSGSTTASVIIDTTAPTGLTVAAANNNGSSPVTIANGGFTNDNTPALSGNAEAGSVVIVRENGLVIGSTTATSGGTWSLTLGTQSDGLHTYSVTATDAAGNVGTASTIALNIDIGTPAIATGLTVTNNDVTPNVTVANGGSTNDNTPVLSGSAEANAIVTVYDGTTVLGSTTASGTGAWSFQTAALTNGSHPLSVTVKDAAGNISPASGTYTVVVDTVAPVASTLVITNDAANVVVPNGGSTNDTTPTLSGTVSAAEAGGRVSIFDNGVLLGTAIVQANGSWTYTTVALGTGTHPISVTVTDAAGNISSSTSASVIIDTTPPAAVTLVANNNNGGSNVVIPNNGATNDNTPLLTGTGEVGARVSVYDGTLLLGTTTVGSGGTWSFTTTALSDGTHTLNVRQTDAAGNTSANASTILTVDTVAPTASTLTITDDAGTTPVTLANGAYTRDTTPTLSGTAQAGAIVTILDGATVLGSVTAGTGGAWTFTTAALTNGAHTLSTTVTDTAGNVSTGNTTATVNVDTVAPAAVSGLAINTAGTVVTGSGEVGATVTVRDAGGAAIGTATVGTGGTWSVSLTTAQTTGATLTVTQADRAGNVSASNSLVGAIRVIATNDTNEVDYSTTQGTINNGTTSVSHTALLTVGLGNVLNASVLSNGNAYLFNVGPDDTRTITLNGAVSSVGLLTNYSLNLYEQQANGTWLLVNSTTNYLGGLISIGTLKGANVTYTNLGTGTYAVVVASAVNVSLLPTTTISTVSDITTLAVTVAATVTGNLLTNDTSSIAGTVPTGTAVTAVSGSAVASTGNTIINTTYGTLTIDSHGNYTYALKAGLNIDTLPTADTFTYSVRDASGALTSATLTVTLHNGAATSLLSVNSLFAETTSGEHDASGSIYGDSTATHTGTLSITNEHGDSTTVSSTGTTSVAGDYGVLSIAANGSYTYTLNAGVDGQSLTHKEVFSYSLAASDGTITHNSFTIDLHPTITGTTGADTITGGAYDDTITTGAGADTLVYHLLATADATGGNGHDTWTDFNVAQGDKVDISNLLIGWNDSTSNINDFVKVDHTSDGNTVLSIDRDGTGTGYSSTQLITLEGVNVSLEELLQQPHQNTTA